MIGSTTTGGHRAFPLMSLNPLAPAFPPHNQSSSNPAIPPWDSTTMSLPLAQSFCGIPPQIISSHAAPINQPNKDGTFSLAFSSRKIHLNRMQQLINHLLNLHLFCPHPSNNSRIVYRLFTSPSNSSTNT